MSVTPHPPIYTLCNKCFESNCDHWDSNIFVNQRQNKSILSNNIVYSININIKCKCQDTSPSLTFTTRFEDIKDIVKPYRCNLCQNIFMISDSPIEYEFAINSRPSKKYPRSKCPQCKGDGEIVHETFAKCEDCEGIGGLVCIECNGLWNLCNNKKCFVGYSKRCYNCKGSKSVITDKEFWKVYPCDLCDDE